MGAISPSELQADLTTSTQLNKEQEKQRHVLFCFFKWGGAPIPNVENYSAEGLETKWSALGHRK